MKTFLTLIMMTLVTTPLLAETPQLSVQGEARLSVPADQMIMTIGVITENKMANVALSQNNATIDKVLNAIKTLNLTDSKIETATFRIDPVWQPTPMSPTPDWTPSIIAFRVTNTLTVQTNDLLMAGNLIDATIGAGANKIGSLVFGLKDPNAARSKAIAEATAQAISHAKTVASASNVTLSQVMSISVDRAGIRPPIAFRAIQAETSVEAGDVDVTAAVTIDYAIESH